MLTSGDIVILSMAGIMLYYLAKEAWLDGEAHLSFQEFEELPTYLQIYCTPFLDGYSIKRRNLRGI